MNPFEEKSRNNYNLIADDYDSTPEGRYTDKFKQLLSREIIIRPGDRVLDAACGNGTLLKMISRKWDIKGYGIDISERMIDNARAKCPGMVFEVGTCGELPFTDRMFDVITVSAAYHHFPDVKAFAKEANRVLKPQGLLYIAEPFYPFILRAICNPLIPLSKAGDVRFYSPGEIKGNFEAHGFEQTEFKREGHIQLIKMRKL